VCHLDFDFNPKSCLVRCLVRFHSPVGEALGYALETKAGTHPLTCPRNPNTPLHPLLGAFPWSGHKDRKRLCCLVQHMGRKPSSDTSCQRQANANASYLLRRGYANAYRVVTSAFYVREQRRARIRKIQNPKFPRLYVSISSPQQLYRHLTRSNHHCGHRIDRHTCYFCS
jgi:hypothetical protein